MITKINAEFKPVDDGLQFVVTIGNDTYTSPIILKEPYTNSSVNDTISLVMVSVKSEYRDEIRKQVAELIKYLTIVEEDETL